MPTRRPRHFVTESDELAAALDAAARRWPEVSRAQLIVRLALEGRRAAEAQSEQRRRRRLRALSRRSGEFTGSYGDGYLERLRQEWPE